MFLLNKSVCRNQSNLLTLRSKIFLRRDLARVAKSCWVLYYVAAPIKIYIYWLIHFKVWNMKYEVSNYENLENEEGRSYTGSNRGIRNSNKALWKMDREIRLGLDDTFITIRENHWLLRVIWSFLKSTSEYESVFRICAWIIIHYLNSSRLEYTIKQSV